MATKALTTTVSEDRKLDRRGFLVRAMGGLSLGFFLPEAGHFFDMDAADPLPQELANAYIKISPNNQIKLMFGGCEMGQGIQTGLAQIMAEELFVDWNQIIVEQSLVDAIVSYGTGGSSGVSRRYDRLRKAGAAARELLILAAMDKTGDMNRSNYKAQSGTVVYLGPLPSPVKTWTYGTLSTGVAGKTVPVDLRLTDPSQFRLIGKKMPRLDIPSKVDGSAKYGIDIWMPNMVFAAIKHCPTLGGVLAATPSKPSSAIAVVPCKASDSRGKVLAGSYNAVAVVATNTWTAKNLANSLQVKWTLPPSTADVDSAGILAQAQALMANGAGVLVAEPTPPAGYNPATYAPVIEAEVASQMGTPTIESTYSVPYVPHATMEVLNCTVNLAFANGIATGGEIWAPNQNAVQVANYAAAATGLPASAFKVNTTYLGGGLGRKIEQDYVSQAVQVALAVKLPVKLTWTREEDFTHDQYRPFALVKMRAKFEAGNIKAWSARTVTPSISQQRSRLAVNAVDSQAVECLRKLPYRLGTSIVEWVPLPAGVPVGYWRSVGASINVFVVESFIDELAKAAGVNDPFQFRYNLLSDVPDNRARRVLEEVDRLSTWRNSLPSGRAWGVAVGEAFGTWVAEVAEISVSSSTGAITVHRVACAVDCGITINPDSVEAQMQGSIVHGLNATLWSQTTFTAGKANERNFDRNRMLRPKEMPVIQVSVVQSSTTTPTGTGEPGVPPIAAAVANAYARLTGKRQYNLPFFPGATMGGI